MRAEKEAVGEACNRLLQWCRNGGAYPAGHAHGIDTIKVLGELKRQSATRNEILEEAANVATWADHGQSHPRAKDANDTIAAAIRAMKTNSGS